MKKVATVFAALAVLAAGLPALLGIVAQDRILELAEAASANRLVQVDVTGYERGWRRSQAILSVTVHDSYRSLLEGAAPGSANQSARTAEPDNILDLDLALNLAVAHGPLLPRGGIGLAEAVVQMDPQAGDPGELLANLEIQGLGEAVVRVGIGSESSYRWTIPPVAYSGPTATFATSGLTGEGTYDSARQRQSSQGRMDRLKFSNSNVELGVDDLAFSFDSARSISGVWPGTSVLTLRNLSVGSPANEPTVVVEGIEAHGQGEVDEAGNLLSNVAETTAESLSATVDGSQHIITEIRFDQALRNLDVDALNAYRDLAFELVGENDPTAFLGELQPIVYGALNAEPEIEIGPLGFNWNDSTLHARILLRIDNEMLPAEPMFSLVDNSLWTRLVAVEVELDADRDVAAWIAIQAMSRQGALGGSPADVSDDILQAQARGTLVTLVVQGMLEETENGYRFRGSYENGVVEVNGTVIPIGAAAQALF